MKYDNQIKYATQIIETFNGKMPLHNWLKDFFRQHKQMGSKDRKQASEMVYCFYRLGFAGKKLSVKDRILTGLFLCNQTCNDILEYFRPSWNEQIGLPIEEKISLISDHKSSFSDYAENIFPWKDQLSNGVDPILYSASFLQQPDLFIRIRPGYENAVRSKLDQHAIPYKIINSTCFSLANTTRLDEIIQLDKEAVIQDLNSQRTGSFFQGPNPASSSIKTWDCCAASGGKSIMLHDLYPQADVTVSDIRESILINLKKRFQNAGLKKYKTFAADLSNPYGELPIKKSSFDLIVADVPCSGSGTWSRNPDSLYFFDIKEIERYQALQKKILANVMPYLSKGGVLVYITCSVFKKENEEMADFISHQYNLRAEKIELLKGYDQKADSMFAARFTP
ncbi:MAG: methyltransferase domain-containing protein [Bacteroidetes bacterium]|nr:methyltransferase domain-containing protein [Bacteroidota bacterium]